ncbi:Pentatricopeptide repeat-containing protein, mitochondrial [Sesamum alatum]|uniref:Pentatricopeptide repeat-containing protein, mitochondrial n=1 Tax=Sesamum alatum TaxID=300844 RepID=A0AAE2CEG1_9LAMI|nr:Pentatricopeptide repeat-containing protein, mitochondrial [Sesamum alatum]
MFRHYFSLTNNVLLRKSHDLPAGHSNPGRNVVLDRSSGPHQLLDEMLKRDVESATSLIGHFAKQNQHREAIVCFLRMLFLDIRPNEYTFGTVIHSSVVLEDLHLGRQIHSCAKKISLSSNVFVGSAMLDLYVKLGHIDDALRAFQDIHEPNVSGGGGALRGSTTRKKP